MPNVEVSVGGWRQRAALFALTLDQTPLARVHFVSAPVLSSPLLATKRQIIQQRRHLASRS